MRKKPPCRPGLATAAKKHSGGGGGGGGDEEQQQRAEGVRRPCVPRSKEPHWGSLGTRGSRYRRSMGLATFPTTSERLKRATRKSTMLRGVISKVRASAGVREQPDGFITAPYTDIHFGKELMCLN